jgi:hypothetical protein
MSKSSGEGLQTARFLMVLSGASPLFILWAIKGIRIIPDKLLWEICAGLVLVPNLFLFRRVSVARRLHEVETRKIGTAEDHRDHLLVYLFAMLLPFYSVELSGFRELAATVAALSFVIFLFWHLNLHYMNILFALGGYRVFTIYPTPDGNPVSGRGSFVVITKRAALPSGEELDLLRLSSTVFFEESR